MNSPNEIASLSENAENIDSLSNGAGEEMDNLSPNAYDDSQADIFQESNSCFANSNDTNDFKPSENDANFQKENTCDQ